MKKTVLFLTLIILGFVAQMNAQTVYVTSKGEKYHQKDCQYLKGADVKSMSLADAKSKGLVACSVCFGADKAKSDASKVTTNVKTNAAVKSEKVKTDVAKESTKVKADADKKVEKADAKKDAAKAKAKKAVEDPKKQK